MEESNNHNISNMEEINGRCEKLDDKRRIIIQRTGVIYSCMISLTIVDERIVVCVQPVLPLEFCFGASFHFIGFSRIRYETFYNES